ncbi:hypothetical protein KCP69_22230 [Salmonella enterica subsp. enterica]|nr:hypothetical protein KCP69_22230 [Salmonella enterica subsp. enterica]
MSAGCHYNAVNPLILRYSTGDQAAPLCWSLIYLYFILVFSQQITFTARGIFIARIPLFVGVFFDGLPPVYLQDLPLMIRPLLKQRLLWESTGSAYGKSYSVGNALNNVEKTSET